MLLLKGIASRTQHKAATGFGSKRFEQPLLEHLRQEHDLRIEQLTFEDREAIKQVMAKGGRFTVTIPGNRNVIIGNLNDHKSAERIADKFAIEVRKVYDANTGGKQIKYLLLTGGGSVAKRVHEASARRLQVCVCPLVGS